MECNIIGWALRAVLLVHLAFVDPHHTIKLPVPESPAVYEMELRELGYSAKAAHEMVLRDQALYDLDVRELALHGHYFHRALYTLRDIPVGTIIKDEDLAMVPDNQGVFMTCPDIATATDRRNVVGHKTSCRLSRGGVFSLGCISK